MTRVPRTRALALVAAVAIATAAVAVGGPALVASADEPFVAAGEWTPFAADTVGHGYVAVDTAARVAYAFSGTVEGSWSRVQALNADTGKPLSPVLEIPVLSDRAPAYVDTKRHVVIYAETYTNTSNTPVLGHLVGIGLRGNAVKQLFRVETRFPTHRIAGLAPDDAANDIVVVATSDGSVKSQRVVTGTTVVELDRIDLNGLVRGALTARWSSPIRLPSGTCPALIQTAQPAGVLVTGDRVYVGCRGIVAAASDATLSFHGASSGVVEVRGAGTAATPNVAVRAYRAPGNFTTGGESLAEDRSRRFVLIDSSASNGLRVFDTDHRRFVGRVSAGQQIIWGAVTDPRTSRTYFISKDPSIGVGTSDLAALEPTQGDRMTSPYAALIGYGGGRRLSFDERTRTLYLPMRREGVNGTSESVVRLRDVTDPYVAPPAPDYAAGTIDAVDRAGVTDSDRAATSRAIGADFQLIGGTASLFQNVTGTDARGVTRPGTRHLRQAYVRSGSLTGDGAVAAATTAEEDPTTDQDRNQGGAGTTFAPFASCADFGASPTKTPVVAPGASVTCDLRGERVTAATTFSGDNGVLVTTQGQTSPVPAPVQVSRASSDVTVVRAPGRGAVTTTITATADGVTIGGTVSFGRVVQRAIITAHGRSGTAKVERVVTVSDVEINGAPVCTSSCPLATVEKVVNDTLDGRAFIEFPPAQMTADRRGTYAELTQDPWFHAERRLDYDKPSDDYVVPAMTIVSSLDGESKSRLVVDLADVVGTASYRTFKLGDDYVPEVPEIDTPDVVLPGPATPTLGPGGTGPAPAAPPSGPVVAQGGNGDGPVAAILDRVRLSLRSLGEALPLLLVWALLGVPSYLAARRRLLLELPMLTRDEEAI